MNKQATENFIINALKNKNFILDAIIYGSSNYNIKSVDIDILVMIKSYNGIVDSNIYKNLKKLSEILSLETKSDIDLVPHTEDEISDFISPLYNPRYNPSLTFGKTIKGNLRITYPLNKNLKLEDLARYVILDNRTITRRQLTRVSKNNEKNIFLSKLGHLFGNVVTYLTLKEDRKYYYCNPSDLYNCAKFIEDKLQINAMNYQNYIEFTRDLIVTAPHKDIYQNMLKIMKWYETFVSHLFFQSISNLKEELNKILI